MWTQPFIDLLFVENCRGCRQYISTEVPDNGTTICAGCLAGLGSPVPLVDWLPLPDGRELQIAAGSSYKGLSRALIKRLKYDQDELVSRDLVRLLEFAWSGCDLLPQPDTLLVPIPLFWWRKLRRGFNQAELLSRLLAPRLSIKVEPRALSRLRPTRSQARLRRPERRTNMHMAFAANPRLTAGKTIILIDDVSTTGSTLADAARAAYEGGASLVVALVVAQS